jgi:hypothetical protein
MKLSIFIVFLIGMAGCTSPQSPVVKETNIAGLSIPDTIDFGVVPFGIIKDTTIIFKNTGTDTIMITSQGFSDTLFKLTNAAQKFNIAPGTQQVVGFSFSPRDTAPVLGFDTISSANNSNIMILRGGAIPFSSFFPSAPTSVTVTLTGLIGQDTIGFSHDFNFSFYTSTGPQQWADTLHFSSSSSTSSCEEPAGLGTSDYQSTDVWVKIDTAGKKIVYLKATFYDESLTFEEIGCGPKDGTTSGTSESSEIVLNGLDLSKDSNGWAASGEGTSLRSVVTTAQYLTQNVGYPFSTKTSQLSSIIGYETNAVLSVSIH